ncbi:MAG: replication-associated recombination protein A [Myxococcales bacterium]|nr:MAG: replication-associated recombination protein A [Myxococcales bacterium]
MSTLFQKLAQDTQQGIPLAEAMRPQSFDDILGQDHLLSKERAFRQAAEKGNLRSVILWGPPGCGKTTLARALATHTDAGFVDFSAVTQGVPRLREIIGKAQEDLEYRAKRTILFIDEIHRFNKGQQDALLPHVERGTVSLIGATTENPSFAINAALLSRSTVHLLHPLSEKDLLAILERALSDPKLSLSQSAVRFSKACLLRVAKAAAGDARRALQHLEALAHFAKDKKLSDITEAHIDETLGSIRYGHDKQGESHHNLTSALIKSMRGSDPDASIYWLMRMLEAGEDPLFIMRRMLIFASEDIGNAHPLALMVATSSDAILQRVGMPEGIFALSQCCLYLATAPKSNRCYQAFSHARELIKEHGPLPVPMHLRNAPTPLLKDLGYGSGYRYPHDEGGYAAGVEYLPEKLNGVHFYEPSENGYEAKIRESLQRLRNKEPK